VDADFVLQAARADQKNIVQALKMTDAESILGGGDDAHLEELRWYVYPKECADAMTKSALDNSTGGSCGIDRSSCSNGQILGALNPGRTGVIDFTVTSHVDQQLEGAGLPFASNGDSSNQSTACALAEKDVPPGDDTNVLFFRDGEHSGEAPLFEIKSGLEEGELSDACQVFCPESGEWVSLQHFMESSSYSSKSDFKEESSQSKRGSDASKDSQVPTVVEKVLFFRDGEHSGEAPLSEIEFGYEEGELSDACHIYTAESGEWLPIRSFLDSHHNVDSNSNHMPAGNTGADVEDGNNSTTTKVASFSKKEARDRAAWGRGNIVSTTGQCSTAVTETGSHCEQKMDGKRHASPTLTIPGGVIPKKARFRHVKPPPKMMRLSKSTRLFDCLTLDLKSRSTNSPFSLTRQ
jgi:hypothetical protein